MSDRLLSKSLESHPAPKAEILLRTCIPEALQAIGGNLDRTLSILQRIEHKLGAA